MRAHEDVAAAAAAHSELGHQYNDALAEGLIERISSEIDKQVDARLAQRGIQPSRTAWANVAMGLGSVGLGIGATAVTLHSLANTGTAPRATVNLGPFHASVMSTTTSISTSIGWLRAERTAWQHSPASQQRRFTFRVGGVLPLGMKA